MDATTKIWALAMTIGLMSGWIDYRTRRIPNWLTVSGAVIGIVLHGHQAGLFGVMTAFAGMFLALIGLLPMVLLRAMGAGDWKLMGSLGAILGPAAMLVVLTCAIFL